MLTTQWLHNKCSVAWPATIHVLLFCTKLCRHTWLTGGIKSQRNAWSIQHGGLLKPNSMKMTNKYHRWKNSAIFCRINIQSTKLFRLQVRCYKGGPEWYREICAFKWYFTKLPLRLHWHFFIHFFFVVVAILDWLHVGSQKVLCDSGLVDRLCQLGDLIS